MREKTTAPQGILEQALGVPMRRGARAVLVKQTKRTKARSWQTTYEDGLTDFRAVLVGGTKSRAAVLVLVALVLTACLGGGSFPSFDFFVLSPHANSSGEVRSPANANERPLSIELRRPKIPVYLRRDAIVLRATDGKLVLSDRERWAGDLAEMIGSTLSTNLNQFLPHSVVSTATGGLSGTKDVLIEVEVSRFEAGPDGKVNLDARLALSFSNHIADSSYNPEHCDTSLRHTPKGGSETDQKPPSDARTWTTLRFSASRKPQGKSVPDQVQAMSLLLAELAQSLAKAIKDQGCLGGQRKTALRTGSTGVMRELESLSMHVVP